MIVRPALSADVDAIGRMLTPTMAAGETYALPREWTPKEILAYPAARGRGVARTMATHPITQAKQAGYLAMQFNFVVSTNDRAIRLWEQLGFVIVGRIPAAFRHPQ